MPTPLFLVLLALSAQAPQSNSLPLAIWVDVDRDGRLDLFLSDPAGGDRLLLGTDGGGFVERAATAGLDTARASRLAVWADYDGDGWPDLFRVRASGLGELMHNAGDGTFAAVGERSGLPPAHGVIAARWLDVEGDGDLDLALWTEAGLVLATALGDGTFETAPVVEPAPTATPAALPFGAAAPDEVPLSGASGSAGAPTPGAETGATEYPVAGGSSSNAFCPLGIRDSFFTNCIAASIVPTLGMLYPLSSELFVAPSGFVGIGTTLPAERLDVAGTLRADGLRMPTGAVPGRVLTTDGLGNASWQPVPATGLNGGGTTSQIPLFSGPGTLADSSIRQFGGGQIAIGTTSATATLGVQGDLSDRALRLVGSGTNGSGAKLVFGEDDDTHLTETTEDNLDIRANGVIGMGPGNVGVHLIDPLQATHSLTVGPSTGLGPEVLRLIGPLSYGHGAQLSFGDGTYATIEEDQDDHLRVTAKAGTMIRTTGLDTTPALLVEQAIGSGTSSPALRLRNTSTGAGIALFSEAFGFDANAVFTNYGTGSLIKCFASGLKFEVKNDGTVACNKLEIWGGADLAEPFETDEPAEPGTVMVIDPDHPGALCRSEGAYDTRVAGVVSGAGGIEPGVSLRQEGATLGETPVALTGRVYVRCSAENGPVRPGDLLTTAATAGHAMRADDPERSFGAVLGKAMGNLDEGTGLVLTLVNLQ